MLYSLLHWQWRQPPAIENFVLLIPKRIPSSHRGGKECQVIQVLHVEQTKFKTGHAHDRDVPLNLYHNPLRPDNLNNSAGVINFREFMKRWILGIWLLQLMGGALFAQGEILEAPRIFYRNERSIGLMMNSNGFGAGGRYAKRINARKKTIYEVGFSSIKHPKEIKINNNYNYSSRSFVFGKMNSFISLQSGWGKQKEMFRKIDYGGISIRRYFSVGPALGILKPIYYEVIESGAGGLGQPYLVDEKFNTATHQGNIYGRSSFFKGIKEISVVPGACGRAGVSFEYSKSDITIHAIETGVALDIFPKRIEIMATDIEKNNFFFLTLFVSYRFGRVVDASGILDEEDLFR